MCKSRHQGGRNTCIRKSVQRAQTREGVCAGPQSADFIPVSSTAECLVDWRKEKHPTDLLIAQPRDLVHKFLLDHEGSQVGCVAGQEDDRKEGPDRDHDFAGGAFRVLHRHRVVEHQAPQEPHGLPDGEGGPVSIWWDEAGERRCVSLGVAPHTQHDCPAVFSSLRLLFGTVLSFVRTTGKRIPVAEPYPGTSRHGKETGSTPTQKGATCGCDVPSGDPARAETPCAAAGPGAQPAGPTSPLPHGGLAAAEARNFNLI